MKSKVRNGYKQAFALMHRGPLTANLLVCLSACGGNDGKPVVSPPPPDVTGPFTGITRRYVVDKLALPMVTSDFSDDLIGHGRPNNQLANLIAALAQWKYLQQAGSDQIASGALASFVEITSDDPLLRDDPTVGVRFFGTDGEPGDVMGAVLTGGHLASNRTKFTHHPAAATLYLPLVARADPTRVPAIGVEVDLALDKGGHGFSGAMQGGIRAAEAQAAWFKSLTQMVAGNPVASSVFVHFFDEKGRGAFTFDDFLQNGLIGPVLAPDIRLFASDGSWHPASVAQQQDNDSVSFGVGIHLAECASGDCARGPVKNHCDDRIRDADETDVDCGGSCDPCPGGASCAIRKDCQTVACTNGRCAQATCADGVRDGFESDVDCGDGCKPCGPGRACISCSDCEGGICCGSFFVPSAKCGMAGANPPC